VGKEMESGNRIYHSKFMIAGGNASYMDRPRVRRLLESAVASPLVLVVAGTGYGKTRAVHSFLEGYDALTMWVQLSERDNVGVRFWENYVHTISLHSASMSGKLNGIGFPDTEEKFARYISISGDEISRNKKYVLVFDDFHLIHDNSVLRFIDMSVNTPVLNITDIILSRTEPLINAITMLSKGFAERIGEDELRFTEEEMAEYLGTQGISLSTESAADVYGDTGGWAFAVNLIALSLRKEGGREGYARSAMKLNIFKLIEREVFLNMPESLRRFMIKLSLIDHLASGLIRLLAEDESLIGEMSRLNSFVRYDAYLDAYLIHHLFLDYLRGHQSALSEDEKREVYMVSARWCAENDYKLDAISYYDKVGDYDSIIGVMSGVSIMIPPDMAKFVLDIYKKCPAEKLEAFARYHAHHLRLLISLRRFDEVLSVAREKVESFSPRPPSAHNNRVLCGAYRALSTASWMMLPVTDRCDFDVYMERANHYYEQSPFNPSVTLNSCHVGSWASMVGTTRKGAMEEYLDTLERAVRYSVNAFNGSMYGLDDLARGELAYCKGDFRNGEKLVTQAYYKAIERGQHEVRNRAVFYMLRLGVASGDMAKIRMALDDMASQVEIKNYYQRHITYDAVTSWYYSLIGVPQHIAGWLTKGAFTASSVDSLSSDFVSLIRAKVYYADQRYTELLSFIGSGSIPDRVLFGKLELKVLEAVCLYQTDERAPAFAALREAYDIASTNELITPFIEKGKDMRSLAAAAMKDGCRGIPRKWLEFIGRKSATYARKLAFVISEYKKENNLGESIKLSRRELEVLKDLYQGFSRSEIAASQGLSINTVKSTLNMLYAKLGADNVADAIRVATEKNII